VVVCNRGRVGAKAKAALAMGVLGMVVPPMVQVGRGVGHYRRIGVG
jgi:hypothetical protein